MSSSPLHGTGAVVVGGSRGIGAAVSALLARLGAGVVVNGRDSDAVDETVQTIAATGGRAVGLAGAASEESVAGDGFLRCRSGQSDRTSAGGSDGLHRLVYGVGIASVDHHTGAQPGQQRRDRGADAARSADHHGTGAVQWRTAHSA